MITIHSKFPASVEEYLFQVENNKLIFECNCVLSRDIMFVRLIEDFLSKSNGFHMRRSVRKAVLEFCDSTGIPYPRIKFPIWSGSFAYMTDTGILSMSLYFLHRNNVQRIVKVLIHELSHLYLLHHCEYINLLKLDLEFRKKVELSDYSFISPIEYCATTVSSELFRSFAICIGDPVFTEYKDEEEKKLYESIHAYKINNHVRLS